MPKFSIVIPVYNVAAYLRDSLDSVLAQTFVSWEAVCVDDGSVDDSALILDEYAARDSRVKVSHRRNGGVAIARNDALAMVRGEWVYFLDGDDLMRHDTLEKLYNLLKDFPCVEAVSIGVDNLKACVDGWANISDDCNCPMQIREIDISRDVDPSIFGRGFVVFKTECILRMRFKKLICGEDWVFHCEAVDRLHVVAVCREIKYGYRYRLGSIINSQMSAQKLKDLFLWRMLVLQLIENGNKVWPRSFLRGIVLGLVEYWAKDFFSSSREVRSAVWMEWLYSTKRVLSLNCLDWRLKLRIRLCRIGRCPMSLWFWGWGPAVLRCWIVQWRKWLVGFLCERRGFTQEG